MHFPRFFLVLLLSAVSCSASAMYKCVGPSGSVSFQDSPCEGKGEKLRSSAPPPQQAEPARPQKSLAKRYEAQYQTLKSDAQRREEGDKLDTLQRKYKNVKSSCDKATAEHAKNPRAPYPFCRGEVHRVEDQLKDALTLCGQINCIAP